MPPPYLLICLFNVISSFACVIPVASIRECVTLIRLPLTMSEQQRKKLQDVGAQTAAMEEDERFVQTPSIPVNDAGTSSNQICFSNASTVNISGPNSWFRQ